MPANIAILFGPALSSNMLFWLEEDLLIHFTA